MSLTVVLSQINQGGIPFKGFCSLVNQSELTWYCCDDLSNLQSVEDGCLASSIEAKDQYPHLFGAP